jgi:class 3 adenylate cyclase/predicted ATPase
MNIQAWLRSLGLELYYQAFLDNDIDPLILPSLTAEDLRDIGVASVGHRRKLLDAIEALQPAPATHGETPAAAPPVVKPEAERRQLTVMFCDLAGSTELSVRLDPEDMREVIGAYQNAVAGEVARYEGHIAKFMGDGVLAYFGYPKAHEDDAERAVRAGLQLVQSIRGLGTAGHPLVARVGIATGLVVVGDLVGEGAAQEEAVIGETPNLAARLQTLAEAGQVVISRGTRRLVGGLFELAELEPRRLKGFAEPLAAFRIVGEGRAEGRFEALRGERLTPLVGREHELGLLIDRWLLAQGGEGRVVLLSGEAGIGKSRLTQALLERIAAEPHVRLRYYCSPYHTNSALHPVIEQLARAAGFAADDRAGVKLDKLEALLGRATERASEQAALLAALLSLPSDGRYPPLNLTPQMQKARTFAALLAQLEGLTAVQPVLMIFEDTHWIDPTTTELFGQIIDRVASLSVLLVITFRRGFTPPWTGHAHVTSLTLSRLGQHQGAAIIERQTGGKALPSEVMGQILAKTDGVPLFVEELTKTVLESGLLIDAGDHYELAGPLPSLAIPATLHDSLMARLDRLAPVREVAQIGAVIGRTFSHELLAAVAPLPEGALSNALAKLIDAELIFSFGALPEVTYSFKHALVQDAAYQSLLKSRRQQLHAQIAEAMETRLPEAIHTPPEVIAHHFTQAGVVEKALRYWKQAGQLAMARSATAEAIAHLSSGLQIVLGLPESEPRDRQELAIQLAMGSAFVAAYGFAAPQTAQAYERAREICERLGDSEALFPVLYGLCLFHLYAADLTSSRAASDRLLELARTSDDRGRLFFAHRAAGVSHYPAGNLLTAREHLERALDLYDPDEHRAPAFIYAFDPKVVCLDYLARTLFPLGQVGQSLRRNDEAIAEARRTGHRNSLALPLFFGGTLRQLAGDRDAVRAMVEELEALATEAGFRFWFAGATILRGWVEATRDRLNEGMRVMEAGIAEWRHSGAEFMVPYFSVLVAQAELEAGRADAAIARLRAAIQQIERSNERWFEPEVHRTAGLARLQLALDDPSPAEACFDRALKAARQSSARMWELRAAMDLASLWLKEGKPAEVRDLLTPIYAGFDEGLDAPDLVRAANLLDATSS